MIINERWHGATLHRLSFLNFLNRRTIAKLHHLLSFHFLVYPLYFSISRSIKVMIEYIHSFVFPFHINHEWSLVWIPRRSGCAYRRHGVTVRHTWRVIGSRVSSLLWSKPIPRLPLAIRCTGSLFHSFVPPKLPWWGWTFRWNRTTRNGLLWIHCHLLLVQSHFCLTRSSGTRRRCTACFVTDHCVVIRHGVTSSGTVLWAIACWAVHYLWWKVVYLRFA